MDKPIIPPMNEWVRGCGKLVAIENVTPPVIEIIDYIFEAVTARVEVRVNGRVIQKFSTFNDFGGEETSIQLAIDEAKLQAERHGKSDLMFFVVKITSQIRMRPTPDENTHNPYSPRYCHMAPLERWWQWGLPDRVEEDVFSIQNK